MGQSLTLRPDPDKADVHGFVEPDTTMTFAEYQGAIEATQPQWIQEDW
jgi:hypothetical protein